MILNDPKQAPDVAGGNITENIDSPFFSCLMSLPQVPYSWQVPLNQKWTSKKRQKIPKALFTIFLASLRTQMVQVSLSFIDIAKLLP